MYNNSRAYNIPGGNWIYYKLYMGTKSADEILVDKIKPLADQLIEENVIDQWFFIRYNDPKYHLRLRFKCTDPVLLHEITSRMHNILQPLIEEFIIWKVQLDTYNKEIERYGLKTMEISEQLFFYDSVMTVNYLENFKDENLRWLFGLKAMDEFLNLFQYTLTNKKNFMEQLSMAFKAEFGKAKILNSNLSDKFRANRQAISDAIEGKNTNNIYGIINERNEKVIKLKDEILALHHSKSLDVNINSLMASHIHMMMNRLFKSKNRAHEMVCYDFLFRYYKSKHAIANSVKTLP